MARKADFWALYQQSLPDDTDPAPSSAAVDGTEVPAEKEKADEELRIDPESGEAFTKAEFIEYYEGTDEWDAADIYTR